MSKVDYRYYAELPVKISRWGRQVVPGMYQIRIAFGDQGAVYCHVVIDDFGNLVVTRRVMHQ